MKYSIATGILYTALLGMAPPSHAADQPYAGQEQRALKALSQQEIDDYLNGRGMGTSKAAELNHYPGPRHVLDEAEKLGLTAQQATRTREIHAAMEREAKRIGQEIVRKEMELESLYATRQATADNVQRTVNDLAKLQGDFRFVHLNAHLSMRDVLSPQQIATYDRLRGYDGGASQRGGHQHKRH